MCERYGADTFRLYEMSHRARWTSPGRGRPATSSARSGSCSGCGATWSTSRPASSRVADAEPDATTLRALHKAIAGVHADFVALHYNTAAAKLIELNNHLTKAYGGDRGAAVGGRAAGADDGPADPAHRRGAVAAAGPRRRRWPTGRSRWPTSATWSPTPSSTRSRSTARCAPGSPWRPTPAPTQVEAAALADEKIVALLDGRGAAQGDRGARPPGQRGGVARSPGFRRARSSATWRDFSIQVATVSTTSVASAIAVAASGSCHRPHIAPPGRQVPARAPIGRDPGSRAQACRSAPSRGLGGCRTAAWLRTAIRAGAEVPFGSERRFGRVEVPLAPNAGVGSGAAGRRTSSVRAASSGADTANSTAPATDSGRRYVAAPVLAALLGDDAALHLGVDPAGVDRGDPHAVGRLLAAQRVGERPQRELARRVRRPARAGVPARPRS